MIKWKKLKRFVFSDRAFQVRAALALLLVLTIRLEMGEAARQDLLLKKLALEKELVARIPEMELSLAQLNLGPQAPPEKGKGFHLEGIVLRQEGLFALVNGEIRTIGDVVDKYEIVQINRDGVAVADQETGEIKAIPFTQQ